MILADTSIWAEFFRGRLPDLARQLEEGQILLHSVVIGELATGNLPRRSQTLHLLRSMPRATEASFDECLRLIEQEHLHGIDIGWCDVQLLAAARLTRCRLWTIDKPLGRAVQLLGIA